MTSVGPVCPAGADNVTDSNQIPDINLSTPLGGQAALGALGAHLPAVAAAHGMSAEQLQKILARDHSARIDRNGHLFYVETEIPNPEAVTSAGGDDILSTGAPYPLEDTLLLHSRPGAAKLVYLDFDGHTLSGTGWNANYTGGTSIQCPPWDIDGNPSVFGTAELTTIQKVWRRVAEDYAPFNVDVTTEYPGETALSRSSSTDANYGMRVLVSPISSYFGNYGGIAYVSVFDSAGDYYKPALVFPEKLANNEKYIAEACAHECGHTLGLYHDGTATGTAYYAGSGSGETGWAPIMGVGYYQNLTQWSKGEYANANNTQDDLAVIANYVGYAADDHGNTAATATLLPAGSELSAWGAIERSTDVDVFKFATGSGAIALNIGGSGLGPNLDITISLYDAAGVLVAANNPTDFLDCSIAGTLSAGTYYLQLKPTGKGDPLTGGYSSYGSLGQYAISATVIAPSGTLPPMAVASANVTSGNAPLAVQFSSSGSTDPDGTILAWAWNFGDGSQSSEANPTHTYTAAGTYTATLTITDNDSGTSSAAVVIQVQAAPSKPIRVDSINLVVVRAPAGKYGQATVRITDLSGAAIAGASVSGAWTGVATGSSTVTTDGNGYATLVSRKSKRSGSITFTVNSVIKTGCSYNPSDNRVTLASTAF